VNLAGTVNVVDAATALPGLTRLIAFSSAAVYGNAPGLPDPVEETTTLAPFNLYGIAKAAGEEVVRRYAELPRRVVCERTRRRGLRPH
jgi:nucleoside-diphosphate-sugar epimerase